MRTIFTILTLISITLSFPLSLSTIRAHVVRSTLHHTARQVGDGVNGNQTGNNGSTGGTGLGDGNGVGFAGTGNDIDTGDDFDIGDGNTTMGDGNRIEIGDRITNINLPINMSEIMASGLDRVVRNTNDGSVDMSIDISMRVRIADGEAKAGNASVVKLER